MQIIVTNDQKVAMEFYWLGIYKGGDLKAFLMLGCI